MHDRDEYDEFKQLAEARSNIYKFFSNIYLREPSLDLIKKMGDNEFITNFFKYFGETSGTKRLAKFLNGRKVFNVLRQEYMSLFRVPGSRYVRPYESVYRDKGLVMGESTMKVKKMYKRAGTEISGEYRGLPDHFGLELEFMHFLSQREADAWKKRDKAQALKYLSLQNDFLEEHLSRWTNEFCSELYTLTKLDFYKGLAEVTKGYVAEDSEEVKLLINEAKSI